MRLLKNSSPLGLSVIASFVLTIGVSVFLLVLKIPLVQILLIVVFLFILSFGVIYFLLQKLIYENIKVIYNSVRHVKLGNKNKEKKDMGLSKNPLEEIKEEVKEWATNYQNEKEEASLREAYRKEFLGNVAHELKTPITNIQGHIWTLLDGALYDKEVNEKFLMKAAKNTDRLQYLVEELLNINQLEQGRWSINKTTFNIKTHIQSVINNLEDKAKKKKVTILFDDTNRKYNVLADGNLITQVITNLLVNSINYCNMEGTVRVHYQVLDKKLNISIEDDGIGISKKDIPRLFERFYRVDQSRSRAFGGTGLGLAIVKHIIDAHDQSINITSTLGEGTTCTFTLDLA